MKKYTFIIVLLFLFLSCASYIKNKKPQGFTYYFKNQNTGLDSLLKIKGYYISELFRPNLPKDTFSVGRVLILYDNGICASVFMDENSIKLTKKSQNEYLKNHLDWGNYIVNKDTIKAQFIIVNREFFEQYYINVKETHYFIKSSTELEIVFESVLSKDYIITNSEGKNFSFYFIEDKIDSTNWMLNKKWFWEEDIYKKRKDK